MARGKEFSDLALSVENAKAWVEVHVYPGLVDGWVRVERWSLFEHPLFGVIRQHQVLGPDGVWVNHDQREFEKSAMLNPSMRKPNKKTEIRVAS